MRTAFQVPNALAPADGVGPLYLPFELDFGAVSSIAFDLYEEQTNGVFDKAQCLYVDNKNNANAITFHFAGTDYEVTVPARAGGIFPIFTNGTTQCTVTTTTAAELVVPVAFVNVPMPLTQWGPITVNVANVTATFTPTVGVFNDASGNTGAGVSGVLFAANAAAIRRVVINPPTNIESIFINFGGAASSALTWPIAPGGIFDTETGPIDQTGWTIFAASAVPYIAKEMV
jgi:hypothetical protein